MKKKYLQKLIKIKTDNKKIAIIGLGVENLQFVDWLTQIVDFPVKNLILADRNKPKLSDNLSEASFFSGNDYLHFLETEQVEMVIKSPGIWSLKEEFVKFREVYGLDTIVSSLVFFLEQFKDQIIGVTGTKGKSTTCSLLTHFLKGDKDLKVQYCGNTTGVSPYQFWQNLDQTIEKNQFYVMELSSFQLQDLGYTKISPKFTIITNYYIDHLDQHKTKEEYWAAKDNIFLYQDFEKDYFISLDSFWHQLHDRDFLDENTPEYEFAVTQLQVKGIMHYFKSKLHGSNNWNNSTLALTAFSLIKFLLDEPEYKPTLAALMHSLVEHNKTFIQNKLSSYQPLERRQELLRQIKIDDCTINFIDDSAATEPEAVISAIETFTVEKNNFAWLIIAGKDKGADLTRLDQTIKEKQNKIVKISCFGEIGQRSEKTFFGLKTSKINLFKTFLNQNNFTDLLKEINLNTLSELNRSTINIIFSPCGASFDEFNTVEDRDQAFRKWVNNL
jgi:UDP-N-acetylmuramoyl-L-alanine---L-glutamate ligase